MIEFRDREFADPVALREGPLAWRPSQGSDLQEVLYFMNETPHRKYGAGLLHPESGPTTTPTEDEAAAQALDTLGAEPSGDSASDETTDRAESAADDSNVGEDLDESDDFEVTSTDIRHPSTLGISFCVRLEPNGELVVRLPLCRRFFWQEEDSPPFPVNGRYEACKRRWTDDDGREREAPLWRRLPAVLPDTRVAISRSELVSRRVISKPVSTPEGSPMSLLVEIFPRERVPGQGDVWLITAVLRNKSRPSGREESREAILYQTYFEVEVVHGEFEKYPESQRPFEQLDMEERSLALLYRESATWAIGHGCAAGWDAEPGERPVKIYADVLPAVELPSMTPDVEVNGELLRLSMRDLAALPDDGSGPSWEGLESLADSYDAWIRLRHEEVKRLDDNLAKVALRHLKSCEDCLVRIRSGIARLKSDRRSLAAFRLANLAMLLQQISTKQLVKRRLEWNDSRRLLTPKGDYQSPWVVYKNGQEDSTRLGSWRAFQIAFLLMSLDGVSEGKSRDREIVDLVWFPTGGGKTEAYLAVMAFYMFYERLAMQSDKDGPRRDGTNVLMRYTLRMLTTQQFQRAASLICAMEFLRRNADRLGLPKIPGRRFSLGLWIGGEGSPNTIDSARKDMAKFRRSSERLEGHPLVLTECPWCRAEIGRFDGPKPRLRPELSSSQWNRMRVRGITDDLNEGPLLHCPDINCEFGQEDVVSWLPVEVIDERIYRYPPSLVIATADKLAMIAYKPEAGALFGRRAGDNFRQEFRPPGLIVQDELHLISGPLGTMYALYEGVIERLCSFQEQGIWIKPKVIASTATIRGAAEQVRTLYARAHTQLFPSPGLHMADSFFGQYARDSSGKLSQGRLYLGIHASDYGSILTAQVRVFAAALFRPWTFAPEQRDPWWTLLVFYNSIRELGGARTLFDSDIRSRLKFMFNREGFDHDKRRNLQIVEELTSRLSQAGIVQMMDRLSEPYQSRRGGKEVLDACLASSIIEVGVDIDRLSLMGVVGQPKTTATYIQVTGRVGRRWWERPGLVLMIYNPSKSRDRSHYEQFHSYHRRLYERVEPTTATPFAISAIRRGLAGALIAWARQHSNAPVQNRAAYMDALEAGYQLLRERCAIVQIPEDRNRSLDEMERVRDELIRKWGQNPQAWAEFPPKIDGEYLMLWPGQFFTAIQKQRGIFVPTSMRQVDRSAELTVTQGYAAAFADSGTAHSASSGSSSES